MKKLSLALLSLVSCLLSTVPTRAASVTLGWEPPDLGTVTNYVVWFAIGNGIYSPAGNFGTNLTATIPLASGTYNLYVTAETAEGASDPSNVVVADLNPPPPPSDIQPTLLSPVIVYDKVSGLFAVTFSWLPPPPEIVPSPLYELSLAGPAGIKLYGSLHPYTATTLKISSLAAGDYTVIVTAKTATTTERWPSDPVVVTLVTPKGKPHPPRNLEVKSLQP